MAEPISHFERLGLPRRFRLDEAELQRQYLAASRAVHPDAFGQAAAMERVASEDAAAAVNAAYRVLRDPFARADYLLDVLGGPPASEVRDTPADFLERVMELRIAMEEARGDAAATARLESDLVNRERSLTAEAERQLEAPGDLRAIRRTLNAWRFVRNLLRDLLAD